MPFVSSPKQTLILWWLLSAGGGAFVGEIKPNLDAKDRRALEAAGLLRIEKRLYQKRGAKRASQSMYAELSDFGWMWAHENLDAEISARSPASAPILRRMMTKLKAHLSCSGDSLASFFNEETTVFSEAPRSVAEGNLLSRGDPAEHSSTTPELEESSREIRDACLLQAEGRTGVRVYLADIRRALPTLSRTQFDDALHFMEVHGWAVLYPLDNPREIRAEDHAAAFANGAGQPRHIIYLKSVSA